MAKKNILIITGSRSTYGLWRPIIKEMLKSKLLAPKILITGMHTLKKFGYTANEVKKEKYKNPSRITNNLLRDMKNYAKYRLNEGKIGKDTELHKIVSQLSIINTYSKRLLENNYFKLIILNPNVSINYVEGKKKQGKLIKYDRER